MMRRRRLRTEHCTAEWTWIPIEQMFAGGLLQHQLSKNKCLVLVMKDVDLQIARVKLGLIQTVAPDASTRM